MPQIKSIDVEIVSSGDTNLDPASQVQLSLLDVSLADAQAITIADARIRCGGSLPISMRLNFDSCRIDECHSYALSVRIEKDGKLVYINTSRHPINPNTVFGTQRVTVDKIVAIADGIHGGNLKD
ncbi:TPA: YbaY family lipoprotein [Pseudomonas putida]|uniref:YbaY family lipoprotein n=1 Tax=Pseudomonas sp. TaxID=306 RepID=UPI0028A594B5|nr:YbaY family lipoprotein [Pseudomonas sp.]